MDVSVVIPLYNGSPWIGETLESVLAQTLPPREIVVVDDGSTDGSAAVARSYAPVTVLENPGNGAGAARDFGLQHVSAPLVTFLDQDDLWHPDHLRFLAQLLSTHSSASAAIAKEVPFEAPSEPAFDQSGDDVWCFDPWDRFPLNSIASPSCAVIRRRALENIGGWPKKYRTSDFHAWFKLSVEAPFLRSDRKTVGKRRHSDNTHQRFRRSPLPYFHSRVDACQDALDYRLGRRGGDTSPFQQRLDMLEAAGKILEAALNRDQDQLHTAAQTLSRSGVERAFQYSTIRFVISMFEPRLTRDPEEERDLLLFIVREWPPACQHARNLLLGALSQSVFSGWSFLACVAHLPHRIEAWMLFLQALKERLRRRLH